jgi:hypothetical protein
MPRSDHFEGTVHHHECFGVDVEDDIFQLGEFRQGGDGKDHFLRVAGGNRLMNLGKTECAFH